MISKRDLKEKIDELELEIAKLKVPEETIKCGTKMDDEIIYSDGWFSVTGNKIKVPLFLTIPEVISALIDYLGIELEEVEEKYRVVVKKKTIEKTEVIPGSIVVKKKK